MMEKMNKIVNEFQCEKINGIMVDVQTANLVVQMHEAVNDKLKTVIENKLNNDIVDGVQFVRHIYNKCKA